MENVTPHDAQARYSRKLAAAGQAAWIGYRDQQTETCDEAGANVIVMAMAVTVLGLASPVPSPSRYR